MLWPGFVFPPDFYHDLVNAVGERTGDRKSSPRKVFCPCSGPNRSGNSLKPRPKTQWYVKVRTFPEWQGDSYVYRNSSVCPMRNLM
jgi:hypothetical protein